MRRPDRIPEHCPVCQTLMVLEQDGTFPWHQVGLNAWDVKPCAGIGRRHIKKENQTVGQVTGKRKKAA